MRAHTLLELIIVLVIMGVLSFVGLQFIPDETLLVDVQMLKQKILQKKSNALGYKMYGSSDYVCVTFDRDYLNSEDNSSAEKVHYTFKSEIKIEGLKNGNVICFDYLGRAYDGDIDENLTNIVHTNKIIVLKYRDKEQNITLYPITGSVR